MIERDLGRIADSLETIAEIMKLKYEFVKRPNPPLEEAVEAANEAIASPKEVMDDVVDEKELDVKKHVEDKEEKAKYRKELFAKLDKVGAAYNKKMSTANLEKKLESALKAKPIVKKPEPRPEEPNVIEPELVANSSSVGGDMPEELQEAKEAEKETVVEEVEPITFDTVRALVSQFAQDFGPEIAKGILKNEFKADKLSQIPEDKYEKLVERIGLEIKKQNDIAANTFLS